MSALVNLQPPAPAPSNPDARSLLATFDDWRAANEAGGIGVRWRRRRVWIAQLRQKLGRHVEARAPLFFGGEMSVVTGENTSRCVLTFGYNEVALTALMLHVLQAGDVMVDIGTHFGYEAMLAARLVGPTGRVIGFEPHPGSRALAQKNLRRFQQAEVRAQGVAAARGHLRLTNNPIELSAFNSLVVTEDAPGDHVDVEVTTLDEAIHPSTRRVALLKVDAEGFELPIIDGAKRLLEKDAPLIVLEADMPSEAGESSPRAFELARHLEPLGYAAYDFDYDGALRLAPLGRGRVHHANILFVPTRRTDLLGVLGLTAR